MEIAVLVLAAGASTRMGQPKQLLSIDDQPLLIHTLRTVEQAGLTHCIVVLGSDHKPLQQLIHERSRAGVVLNPNWQNGMGSSLKAGLHSIVTYDPSADTVLVLVCDQPELTPDHLRNLIRQHEASGSPIVASSYAGTVGVPALFNRSVFAELLEIDDGYGAQKILRQHADSIVAVNFPGGAIDLDTPLDYENYVETKKPPV